MKTFTVLLFVLYPILIAAQEVQLLESINYQNAVGEGTRCRDGNPGSKYWQNHADYDITVRLDTAAKKIYGREHITYYNNSPDTLANIVIRLYQNRYKKGAIRDMEVHPGNIHEGMELDTIVINGKGISLNGYGVISNGTNLSIPLEHPLQSKSNLHMHCEWSYKIPLEPEFRRTGYYKDNAWFIGYFYPQIAVYDDMEVSPNMKGWDYLLFHKGFQEFYNDFNNFQVSIEVPKGFYVWATGGLTNAPDVYTDSLLHRLDLAYKSDEIVHIISRDDFNKNLLIGNKWKFEANNVTDFGFGTASNYIWDGTSVLIGGHRVFVDVAYHPESMFYPQVIDIARNTVKYTSEVFPGIIFPYNHTTTFNGMLTGGMEFPMIANNSDENDSIFMILMSFHEICHNYLPFMMGINEKRYQFMDEGFTQLFTDRFLLDVYGMDYYAKNTGFNNNGGIYNVYNGFANEEDFPIINAYSQIDLFNVRYQCYVKPGVAYRLFAEMVGEDKFLSAFQTFVNRWKGKHPTPYDFFYTMNDVLNQNYNWFWKAWFFDFGYPDLGIEIQKNQIIIKRIGTGSLPLPINLTIELKDKTLTTISKPMNIWQNGEKQIAIEIEYLDKVKSVRIDTTSIPDINHSNNYLEIN